MTDIEELKRLADFREFLKGAGLFDGEYAIPNGPKWISEKTQGAWIAWLHLCGENAKLKSEMEEARKDAEIGAILIGEGFYDRMNDLCKQDTAERIVTSLIKRVDPILTERYKSRMAPYFAALQQQGDDAKG